MDLDEETSKFKGLLACGLIFLVVTVLAFNEIRYLIWGVNTDAKVTRIEERTERRRRGREVPYLRLEMEYKDKQGQIAKAADRADVDFQVAKGDVVKVQYIPGGESFRLKDNNRKWALWLFFVALGVFGFYFGKLFREGQRTSPKRTPARRG